MKINITLKALMVSCLFFVLFCLSTVRAAAAARIYLDPASSTQVIGNDFQINVDIDTAGTSIFGADAVINYPSDGFTVKSISSGSFFSDNITPSQSAGHIFLRGSFLSSITHSGSGNGTFATITFNALKAGGTGTIGFSCSGSGNDTDIINTNGTNILSCSSLNQSVVTFKTGETIAPTPTPGTNNNNNNNNSSTNGPTNACGGTCGSIYNCNVNLFCYQGYCRNPDCPSSLTCGCPAPTVSPKATPKPTVNPTAKATPVVVTLAKATPYPTPMPSLFPTPAPQNLLPSNFASIIIWAGIGLLAIIVIIIAINALREKSPPKIIPPTTNYPPNPPMPENPPTQGF